jgi:hypothetical protein
MHRRICEHFDFSRAARSEAVAAAVAAGEAEVPWVGRVGGPGSVALSPVLSVVLAVWTIVPSSQLFLWGSAAVRSRTGRPSSLPARQAGVVRIHLGLQEVQQRHGQLQVGALVAMHGVIPPAGNPPGHPSCSVASPREGLP